ncbi:hypothetical protein [Campylobacter lari]|uniref:hypothetical protein n=1 Tax=Campylobacter lari TaxID=201 RepID=UPI0021583326|nr:hypothetical protein [Campylobacter lari]MCR6775924.1 hypothetical protein [Campylobacter lari]
MENVSYCRMSCLDGKINGLKYFLDVFLSDLDNKGDVKSCVMFDNEASICDIKDMIMAMLDNIKDITIEQDNCLYNVSQRESTYKGIVKDELGKEFSFEELEKIHQMQEEKILREMLEEDKNKRCVS